MDLKRIDLCWSAVAGLSMYEPIRGADFQARGLLMALRAGEPFRVARAMAMEAGAQGHRRAHGIAPGRRDCSRPAAALAERIDSPHCARDGRPGARHPRLALSAAGRTPTPRSTQAEELFRNHCTGVAWERDTGHNFALWALLPDGRDRRAPPALDASSSREAQERGDRVRQSRYPGRASTRRSSSWPPTSGPNRRPSSRRRWAPGGRRPLNLQQTPAFDSLMHIDLYRGDVTRAWARLGALWPEYAAVAALPGSR